MSQEGNQNPTQEQSNNKPWLFKKGQSGNPGGRPKGSKSLKTYAREMLESMNDEERQEFMNGLPKDVIWEMAEGKAQASTDMSVKGDITVTITKYADKPSV